MGGSDAFADFEIKMLDLAQVNSPTLLQLEFRERNMVNHLMGLPEVESVHQVAQIQTNEQATDEFTMGTMDETQVNEAQKSKAETVSVLQMIVSSEK